MAASETHLQQEIRLALGTRGDVKLYRNNCGSLPDPRTGRLVTFGLARGSADLIGWRSVVVTPEMVGATLAVFLSIEVKTPTGRLTPQQRNWQNAVLTAGGITGVARSVPDALRIATTHAAGCSASATI